MKKEKTKIKYPKNPFMIMVAVILVLYSVSLLLPLVWGLFTSLKTQTDYEMNPIWFPKNWKFSNWLDVFDLFKVSVATATGMKTVYIETMFLNSILYCGGCVLGATFVPCIVAYIVAKYPFKFLNILYTIVIVVMIIPIIGNLPSQLELVRALGLYDTFFGSWIMMAGFTGVYFLIFHASFKSLSWAYAEAAMVDGASNWKIMTRIMLPLVKTTIGVVALLNFIGFWNEYTTPLLFLPSRPTVALGLFKFNFESGEANTLVPIKVAGCIIVMLPTLIAFLVFKDKLIGNLTLGGIKG